MMLLLLRPSRFILFFLVFLPFSVQTQSLKPVSVHVQQLHAEGKSFAPVGLFSIPPRPKEASATELGQRTQFLRLDREQLQQLLSRRPESFTLLLPWHGDTLRIELYQAPVLTDAFSVQTSAHEPVNYTPGAYYRGTLAGEPSSVAALSFFDDDVMGVISHPVWGNLNLGRLDYTGNLLNYVLYNDQDLPGLPHFGCVELEKGEKSAKTNQPLQKVNVAGCVQVFFECDYELFQNKGTVVGTVNYVTGFFNVVSTLYNNEMVTTAISQIFVWTTPDDYSTTSSADALTDFMNYRTSFDGDLAHLVGLGGGGLGGIAFLDVLCSGSFNYAFSNINSSFQSYPTYSWTVEVVTHEMGHNLSSNHTHWCGWANGAIDNCGPTAGYPTEGGCSPGPTPTNGGTIMSYCHLVPTVGINFSNGFGPEPGDAIRNAVGAAACLASNCPASSCPSPTALTVSVITSTGATIGWNATAGATSYNLQYRVSGTSAWTTVTGASNPYALTGLFSFTRYEVQVQAVCGGNASAYQTGLIFKTLASACPEPGDLTASNPTPVSIVLNWTENGTAGQWEIQYGLAGFTFGSGTIAGVSAKPYTLMGLNGNTAYDYYVRAICGGGLGNSGWVGPLTFYTELDNDNPSGAIELFVDQPCPGVNAFSNVGAGTFSGEFSPTVGNGGYWNTGINNTVWFKFSAPSSGAVKVTTDIAPLGSLDDTQLALYNTDNPTSINHLLVSNEDGGTIGAGYATLGYYCGLTPGATYYIQVDGWGSVTGTFCIEVYEELALANPGATCKSYSQTQVNGNAAPNKWFNIYSKPNSFDIGLPVAAIKSSVNLGTVTVKEILNTSVLSAPNGVEYMQRYYDVTATQNQGGPKQVRLFYTHTELENLKDATGMPLNIADDLNISHYDGTVEDCSPNNNLASGTTLLTNVAATYVGASDIFYVEFQSPGFSEMGAIFGQVPLPVELLYFTGKVEKGRNSLEWATSAEKEVAFFAVQRSANGLEDWTEVGRISPNTTQTYPKRYLLDDTRPLPQSWYRLKITDLDGTFAYSDIVLLEQTLPDGLIRLYPNPADDLLYAEYQSSEETTVTVRLIGSDGKRILEQSLELVKGKNTLPFNVANLPAGLYYFAVRGAAGLPFVKN
ncbi:MAG: fibronectin type III domain-containing protein [Lewinellaceae bacterium]|nr:fibronectin type III domain-containing protein [Lewinellaceae bacterium]